jgi:hypothetical protein
MRVIFLSGFGDSEIETGAAFVFARDAGVQ